MSCDEISAFLLLINELLCIMTLHNSVQINCEKLFPIIMKEILKYVNCTHNCTITNCTHNVNSKVSTVSVAKNKC